MSLPSNSCRQHIAFNVRETPPHRLTSQSSHDCRLEWWAIDPSYVRAIHIDQRESPKVNKALISNKKNFTRGFKRETLPTFTVIYRPDGLSFGDSFRRPAILNRSAVPYSRNPTPATKSPNVGPCL